MTEPPDLFDPGRILSPPGGGPHGIVVRAAVTDETMLAQVGASSVAVKIVAIGGRLTATLRDTVSRLMATVRHASLVEYHGVWSAPGGEAWIVSDLCENGSVPEVLAQAGVADAASAEKIAAYVLRTVLLALDALHATSLVHGDVRAQNCLVDGKGRVKLCDYGVYHVLEAAMRLRVSYPGARLWPAPELVERRPYDAAAEVWAVGVAAIELVEGRASVLRAHQSATARGAGAGAGAPPALPALRDPARWSPQLAAFIAAACAASPAARPTAAELLQSGFVALADGGALAGAVARAATLPTPARLQALYDASDAAQTLYRRNNCVRAFVDLDAVDAEDFVEAEARARDGGADKPAVEVALRTALRNRRRDAAMGVGGAPGGGGGAPPRAGAEERLAVFVETIDMAGRRAR